MKYTREQLGKELKEKVFKKIATEDIGAWSFTIYMNHRRDLDSYPDLHDVLMTLATMEEGPEFAYSYERLYQIADDLIEGREVDLSHSKNMKVQSLKQKEDSDKDLKQRFGKELMKRVLMRENSKQIAQWSLTVYSSNIDDEEISKDQDFNDLLLAINMMDLGQEYEISLETLEKVANDLIEGKVFNINSRRYQI